MSENEFSKAFALVRENSKRLKACHTHHFPERMHKLGERLRCSRCGGDMHASDVLVYIKGYQDAVRDMSGEEAAAIVPDQIWPHWNSPLDGYSKNK